MLGEPAVPSETMDTTLVGTPDPDEPEPDPPGTIGGYRVVWNHPTLTSSTTNGITVYTRTT